MPCMLQFELLCAASLQVDWSPNTALPSPPRHSSGSSFAVPTLPAGWSTSNVCYSLQLVPGAPSTIIAFCAVGVGSNLRASLPASPEGSML